MLKAGDWNFIVVMFCPRTSTLLQDRPLSGEGSEKTDGLEKKLCDFVQLCMVTVSVWLGIIRILYKFNFVARQAPDQQSREEEPGKNESTMIEVSCLGLLFIALLLPSPFIFSAS